jgi:hypothetical protein
MKTKLETSGERDRRYIEEDEGLDAADLCGISVRINGVYYACTRPAGHRGGHAEGKYAAWARHYRGDEEYE